MQVVQRQYSGPWVSLLLRNAQGAELVASLLNDGQPLPEEGSTTNIAVRPEDIILLAG